MFSFNVCLQLHDLHGYLIWVLVSECDEFEYCDVTSMMS